LLQKTKDGKIIPNSPQTVPNGRKIPNGHKLCQKTIKYAEIFHSKALKITKMRIFGMKITIWQPWLGGAREKRQPKKSDESFAVSRVTGFAEFSPFGRLLISLIVFGNE
jgi:hypothetical protein